MLKNVLFSSTVNRTLLKAMATIAATLKVTEPGGGLTSVCVVFGETNKLADNIQLRLYHRTYSAAGLTNTVSSEITGDY